MAQPITYQFEDETAPVAGNGITYQFEDAPPAAPAAPSDPSFMDRNRANFDRRIANAQKIWDNPDMTSAEKSIGNVGQGLGMVADIPMEMLKSGASVLPDFLTGGTKRTLATLSDSLGLKALGQGYNKLEDVAPRVTNVLDAAGNALNLGGTLGVAGPVAQAVGAPIKAGAVATKNAFFPKPTSEEALRQILQAARGQKNPKIIAKNVEAGGRALDRLDLKGVNTYNGIRGKLDEAIPALSKSVDDVLAKDTSLYKLDDLTTPQPVQDIMQGGQAIPQAPIEVNFVNDALDQLGQYYGKVGQKGKAADMANTLERATTTGLTKKEINDIARTYNKEFSDSSFNKNGELLNSIAAGQHETIRSGVKEVARRGMPAEAAELDGLMSDIYRTRDLISRNEAAVQRLKDTYKERGLGEKMSSGLLAFADLATMGTVKGALMKLLPRNMGMKVNNWAEIEGNLARNLAILEKANAAKTGEEMASIIRQNMKLRQTKTIKNPTSEEIMEAIKVRYQNPSDQRLLEAPRRDPTLQLPAGQGFELINNTPPAPQGLMSPPIITPQGPTITRTGTKRTPGIDIAETDPIFSVMNDVKAGGGFNIDILRKDYGAETVNELMKKRPGIATTKGTLTLDEFAADSGFPDGDTMMQAMLGAQTKRQFRTGMAGEVDARAGGQWDIIKKGYEPARSVQAYNLEQGDKVIKNGEIFKVMGEKDGLLTLKDGETIKVLMDSTLNVDGIKPKNKRSAVPF